MCWREQVILVKCSFFFSTMYVISRFDLLSTQIARNREILENLLEFKSYELLLLKPLRFVQFERNSRITCTNRSEIRKR